MLRIAPMGRFIDAVPMSFDSTGHFYGRVPVLDTTLEGKLVLNGGDLGIKVGRLTVGGLEPFEIEVSAERLSPMPAGQ
jgi:hypothetical protein